ncbi:craniofacial development protein 2-like [Mytilus edulis]|uniref:craniofacial development protein 2-like n=1 Tax=Mytilus edulis TaxID=6550 RepID=UPI0039EE9502
MYATCKTAEVEREMDRYNIKILTLNEVRWLDSGKLTLQNGKVLLYSGRNDGLRQARVGRMLSSQAKKALMELNPINERLMYASFHTSTIKISIITVYAPTNDATDETKESFIEQLDRVIEGTHKHDILLVMEDFNAKVGMNNEGHENFMGRHGIGRRNENAENLLDICQRNNLVITGTIFPHKDKHKVTWISPNKKTENQIDHYLVTRQHRTSILDTRSMKGADIGSNHELLKCKLRIKLKKYKIVTVTSRKRFDTTKLQRPEIRKAFSIELKNRFQLLDKLEDIETFWEGITKCYKETSTNTLGFKERGQKPWISNESWKLVDERRQLKERTNNSRSERVKNNLHAKYSDKDKEVKKSMRNDKRQWTDNLIEEAEKATSNGMMKTVYEVTKTICNEQQKPPQVIKDKSGNPLSSHDEKLNGKNTFKKS